MRRDASHVVTLTEPKDLSLAKFFTRLLGNHDKAFFDRDTESIITFELLDLIQL